MCSRSAGVEARGNNVSPVHWAIERGVPFTVHNDAPIVPPIRVERGTGSGRPASHT